MRLIDAEALREKWLAANFRVSGFGCKIIDAAPTVDVPQPMTRDGVLAAVKAIEDAGGKAVVEVMHTLLGVWMECWPAKEWANPDVPRWNVRVRAVGVETETVPLTQLVGRTIKGETEVVGQVFVATNARNLTSWRPRSFSDWLPFPDGTLDLATGLVTVVKGEA